MEDRGGGFFEAVFRIGWPTLNKVTRPDAYETSDLFARHPIDSEFGVMLAGKTKSSITLRVKRPTPFPVSLDFRQTSNGYADLGPVYQSRTS
jgi:hypothetical protein